ncbi:CapA family protein [Actinotalea sp. AC32]|nr:CapA family protein [Actinotalea sp. AC32]
MTRHARAPRRRAATLPVTLALVVCLATATAGALAATDVLGTRAPTSPSSGGAPTEDAPAPAPTTPAPTPTPTPEPFDLTLVAAGDVLPHQPVLRSASASGAGYDFSPLLDPMNPWVGGADLALCHLEVPIAPDGTAPSGYPVFGAPVELARDLREAGWDGCSTASNHSLDRGRAGVVATLDALDAAGLGHVGTARTTQEADAPQVYELVRGDRTVRVAHLAATYGTNGLPIPADAPFSVRLIDTAQLVEAATRARAAGADVVVASVHCCIEYVSEPTDEQIRIATELAASGVVDLLIGHHAHVPQPVELLAGGPRGEGMWVAHGLGNMLSNQDAACCSARTDSGLLLSATFTVPPDGPPTVSAVGWTALTVDRAGGHRVHPLPSTGTGAALGTLDPEALAARHARVAEVVGQAAPERLSPPTPTGDAPVVVPRPVG